MREREAEIMDINKKMTKVNEIYKDLAGMIDGQQDLIDNLDINIEEANAHTQMGAQNYDEARLRFENPIMADPFGEKLGKKSRNRPEDPRAAGKSRVRNAKSRSRKSSSYDEDDFDCKTPFESIQDDLKDVVNDVKIFGSKMFLACTAPDTDFNEYAYR